LFPKDMINLHEHLLHQPLLHFCSAATACATPATLASKAIRKPAIRDCSSKEGLLP